MSSLRKILVAVATASAMLMSASAGAQEAKHYRFAYDQPKTTGYGILGDIFSDKLKALSKGTMLIDQYPGAQLGQEPQVLQLVKSGDVEFCISSSANAATLSPQAGVMSMHFLFRSESHLIKAIADPEVSKAVKAMIADTVQGAHVIALSTLGLRSMYSKREIKNVGDMKGLKVRVQATPTEDTISRPMARRSCTCRSAASTPRCRPASLMSRRTASTPISPTSITKSRRCFR
jgi:TRAP-type transport system periplasmic protein